jgi:hypothetical protein
MKKLFALITFICFIAASGKLLTYHQSLPLLPIESKLNQLKDRIPEGEISYITNIDDENKWYYFFAFHIAPKILRLDFSKIDSCNSILSFTQNDLPAPNIDSFYSHSFSDTADGFVLSLYIKNREK